MLALKTPTDARWLALACRHLDDLLVDHAHCEHKAAVTALAFTAKYPDDDALVQALAALASEEARHFAQVHAVVRARGASLGFVAQDDYAKRLLACARSGHEDHRLDRLLVCALIEARSCERMKLLADAVDDPVVAALYRELFVSEAGHATLFLDLAVGALARARGLEDAAARGTVRARLDDLATAEAAILDELPLSATMHGGHRDPPAGAP